MAVVDLPYRDNVIYPQPANLFHTEPRKALKEVLKYTGQTMFQAREKSSNQEIKKR